MWLSILPESDAVSFGSRIPTFEGNLIALVKGPSETSPLFRNVEIRSFVSQKNGILLSINRLFLFLFVLNFKCSIFWM